MEPEIYNKEEVVGKRRPLQKGAIAGFVIFVIFGYFLAIPCLCREGAIVGYYKSIFYMIVFIRLLFGIVGRNLTKADYLLWVGGYVLFCIIVDSLY